MKTIFFIAVMIGVVYLTMQTEQAKNWASSLLSNHNSTPTVFSAHTDAVNSSSKHVKIVGNDNLQEDIALSKQLQALNLRLDELMQQHQHALNGLPTTKTKIEINANPRDDVHTQTNAQTADNVIGAKFSRQAVDEDIDAYKKPQIQHVELTQGFADTPSLSSDLVTEKSGLSPSELHATQQRLSRQVQLQRIADRMNFAALDVLVN